MNLGVYAMIGGLVGLAFIITLLAIYLDVLVEEALTEFRRWKHDHKENNKDR